MLEKRCQGNERYCLKFPFFSFAYIFFHRFVLDLRYAGLKTAAITMRTAIQCLFLLFAFAGLAGCKTAQLKESPSPQKGLYKVTVLYPNGDGKTFDLDYYTKKHMPMVAGFIGNNLKFYEIEKGIAGRTPTDNVPYLAIGIFYVRDMAAYNESIAKNREAIISDFKNYTNIQPVVQVSEITNVVYTYLE